jgi:prepilin peptidase CpaA
MIGLTLYIFGLFVVAGAALLAAVNDARAFKIPNYLSALAIVGFLASYIGLWVLPGPPFLVMNIWWMHVASAVIMFFITLVLFGLRAIGAGDAKFASALAIWFGAVQGLPLFIFYTSLFGGVLGILTILLRKYKPFVSPPPGTWVASAQSGQNRVPYGIAISVGFLTTAHTLGYFNFDALFARVTDIGR